MSVVYVNCVCVRIRCGCVGVMVCDMYRHCGYLLI